LQRTTALVILESKAQTIYFNDLEDRYRILFRVFTPHVPLFEQVEIIAREYQHEHVQVVFGVTDEPALLAQLLAERWKLQTTSGRSLCRAQNKGLFAQAARKVNATYPETAVIFTIAQAKKWKQFPAFLRPAKGSLSMYSYKVHSAEELVSTIEHIQKQKRILLDWSSPFYDAHAQPTDPPAHAFLIQPYLQYPQFTLDGYIQRGRATYLGVTESIYSKDRHSFERFDFPAKLPATVYEALYTIVDDLLAELQYDNSTFNVEFFVTGNNQIVLIELNTRLSLQFVPLMKHAYVPSNIEIAFAVSQGITPKITLKKQPLAASSCVLRSTVDRYVEAIPSEDEVSALQKEGIVDSMTCHVRPHTWLSDYEQDSYTYMYAYVDISGKNVREIQRKLIIAQQRLSFVFRND
jgi:hypothetical protein